MIVGWDRDNDGTPDWPTPLDSCPVDDDQFCFRFGPPCPWNPIFFDCAFVDCNDLVLRLSSLINPDPTEDLLIPVLSSSPYEVVVGAIAGMTLDETVQALLGEVAAGAAQAAAASTESLTLKVVSPGGEVLLLAVYEPSDVIVGDLDGANALTLRFDPAGGTLEIVGTVFVAVPVQGRIAFFALSIAFEVRKLPYLNRPNSIELLKTFRHRDQLVRPHGGMFHERSSCKSGGEKTELGQAACVFIDELVSLICRYSHQKKNEVFYFLKYNEVCLALGGTKFLWCRI